MLYTTQNNYLYNSNNNDNFNINNDNNNFNINNDNDNNNFYINNNINDESNNILDKWISEMRYNDWNSRQLKITYEINQKLNEFNEFRKNKIYNL